uniref:ACB domain-containing protein n=1 Tax=Ditylenchus dipsaci TaxID=166011 RepID=A0A915D1A9_9BILA
MLPIRLLRCSGNLFTQGLRFSSTFEDAQKKMKMLQEEPDTSTKLQIYGLFKQGTAGDATGGRLEPLILLVGLNSMPGSQMRDCRKKKRRRSMPNLLSHC